MQHTESERLPERSALGRGWLHSLHSLLLLLSLTLALPLNALAQATSLPPWVVPVVRLVSPTHVVPTTGLVISSRGHVLVPLDFVADGSNLMVLDGGPDPVRHGRPASVLTRLRTQGLAVLEVEHFSRSPVSLADTGPEPGQIVQLLAYPPAELIAAGGAMSAPLARMELQGSELELADGGLPNVTGALVNGCGQLLGFSTARGVPSMAHTGNTIYLWRESLLEALVEAGLALASDPCGRELQLPQDRAPEPAPGPAAVPVDKPVPEKSAPETPTPDSGPASVSETTPPAPAAVVTEPKDEETTEAEAGTANEPLTEPAEAMPAEPDPEPDLEGMPGALESENPQEPEPASLPEMRAQEEGSPGSSLPETEEDAPRQWPTISLPFAIMALIVLYLIRRHGTRARALATSGQAQGRVRAQTTPVAALYCLRPDPASSPSADMPLRPMAGKRELVLGRGDAGLQLDFPTVSRRHAVLTWGPDGLALTDLNSSNGTRVNGQPCLPNEAVRLQPGDQIQLGAATFTLLAEGGTPR